LEKEIYELTNLDYFTFLLINYLGYQIENEYFNDDNNTPYLIIDPEEIATLAFNVGDSFESFLENNCFGDCSLSCPTKLNERINPDETDLKNSHLNIIQIINSDDLSKKQFLLTDILNYVVLDTLYDFYNYEIGLDLDDTDIGLMQFADFITVILEKFVESRGQSLLKNPKEPATGLFENIIEESEPQWEDTSEPSFEQGDEKEEWKYGNLSVNHIVQEYLGQAVKIDSIQKQLIEYFRIYAAEYSGILQIDDFAKEDLEEFFLFWLLREISLEEIISVKEIKKTFEQFFIWLELSKNIDLKSIFDSFLSSNLPAIENTLKSSQLYFKHNSLVSGILEANVTDAQIIDGFFQVEHISGNGFLRLRDIHFRQVYLNVKVNIPEPVHLKETIIDASIKFTAYGWRVIHLEYIFPLRAKPYLH
jgi:hypothetical protein